MLQPYSKNTFKSHFGIDTIEIRTTLNDPFAFVEHAQTKRQVKVLYNSDGEIKAHFNHRRCFFGVDKGMLTFRGTVASYKHSQNICLPDADELLETIGDIGRDWQCNLLAGSLEGIHLAGTFRTQFAPAIYLPYLTDAKGYNSIVRKTSRTFIRRKEQVVFYDKSKKEGSAIKEDNILRFELKLDGNVRDSIGLRMEDTSALPDNLVRVRDLEVPEVRRALLSMWRTEFLRFTEIHSPKQDIEVPLTKRQFEKSLLAYAIQNSQACKDYAIELLNRMRVNKKRRNTASELNKWLSSVTPTDALNELQELIASMEGVFEGEMSKCMVD